MEPLSPRGAPAPEPAEGYVEDASPALVAAHRRAGLADLVLHLALLVLVVAGLALLGVTVGMAVALPIGLFVLVFSLVYTVVPLALWGHTPGMAWAGVAVAHRDGRPLGFGAATRHWLGSLLTVALGGVPLLFGLPTLADRLADSRLAHREP